MYCPCCGAEVTLETTNFCRTCGFDIILLKKFMANPACVNGTGNVQQPAYAAPVAPSAAATQIPNEDPAFQIPARPDLLVRNTRAMYTRAGNMMPPVIKDSLHKIRCMYCDTVFTYYKSNTLIHRNYPGGYVDCPMCRRHIGHHRETMVAEFDINVSDYS